MNPNPLPSPEKILKSMGVYNALTASSASFANICFRVIAGVTAGLPIKSVAYYTLIERVLNFTFEVPSGRWADKWGRVPVALVGHFLVVCGALFMFLAALLPEFVETFLLFSGIAIGVGIPLESGAVSGFYQEALERSVTFHKIGNEIPSRSFTLSQRFGFWITTFAVVLAFLVLAVFERYNLTSYVFLFEAFVFSLPGIYLLRNYIKWGDPAQTKRKLAPMAEMIRAIYLGKKLLWSVGISVLVFLSAYIFDYFIIVALGHDLKNFLQPSQLHGLSQLQIISSKIFAWILAAFLLPLLVSRLTERTQRLWSWFVIILTSLISSVLTKNAAEVPVAIIGGVLVLASVLLGVAYKSISAYASNFYLQRFNPCDYSTAISLKMMPSHLVISLYSFYLLSAVGGATSMSHSYLHVAVLGLISVFWTFAVFRTK